MDNSDNTAADAPINKKKHKYKHDLRKCIPSPFSSKRSVGRQGANKYTQEVKLDAVTAYFKIGVATDVAKKLDIPYATLTAWRNSEWWNDAMDVLKEDRRRKYDVKLEALRQLTLDEIEDRLVNGDEKILKGGVKVKQKVPFSALTSAGLKVVSEQLALQRGEATSIVERVSNEDTLKVLAEQFKKIAVESLDPKVIEGVLVDDND